MEKLLWFKSSASLFIKSFHLHFLFLFPNLWRRRQWHPTPVLLPGKSHGRRSLVGCSPWGHWESDTTERLHFHFSLSSIGEGNGHLLQYSCLENPRDRGAWRAAVSRVAQSRTRLKRLSSSSSSSSSKVLCRHLGLTSSGFPLFSVKPSCICKRKLFPVTLSFVVQFAGFRYWIYEDRGRVFLPL